MSDADPAADLTVDASGMCCPMPVVEARRGVKSIEIGQTMELIATDPGIGVDMPAWAKNTGHEIVSTSRDEGTFRFLIRRAR